MVFKSSKGLCDPGKTNPWQNTTMCQKEIKTSKSGTARLVEDAPLKSILITFIEKNSIFLRNMPEKPPQYRQFTRHNFLFEKTLLLFWFRFSVDPLPVLVSP